jgi:hypothetical protein
MLIKLDKEGYFILIKGEIHQKEIGIIKLYASNVSAPNFIKHTLKSTYRLQHTGIGRFNTPLSPTDGSSKQKSIKKF